MKGAKGLSSRRLALEALIQIEKKGTFTANALAKAFERTQLSDRDRAFVTALVMGVTRRKTQLDAQIKKLSTHPLQKLPVPLLNILRLGIFQLEEMPDIPPSAVINTCAELAKSTGHIGHVRLANGLLRNYSRTKGQPTKESELLEDEPAPDAGHKVEKLSQKYSMPVWIVERWLEHFGEKETATLASLAQEPAKLVLRTCSTAITVEGLKTFLESRDITVTDGLLVPSCLIVESTGKNRVSRGAPQSMPGYSEGLYSFQDEASAFVSIVVDPKPGETVVDLCAAPGGKTTHLAELMDNTGQIIAVDKSDRRLELIRTNRSRLGLTNIKVQPSDGRTFTLDNAADRVLVDAPCTGTGVLGKRPDIRYQRSQGELKTLVELQRDLLKNAAALVKPGGVLVYSTCSLEPEENVENMQWFLDNHKDYKLADITPFIPGKALDKWRQVTSPASTNTIDTARQGFIQLLPSRHGVSGFFVCRLTRNPQ